MKANLLPLLALALLLAQCKKKEPDPTPPIPADPLAALPAETQTGAGTFGCLVNGKPYKGPFSSSARGDWQSATRLAIGSDTNLDGLRTAAGITMHTILEGKLINGQVFTLIPSTNPHTIFSSSRNEFTGDADGNIPCYYSGNYIKTGQVTLTKFDGPNRIASGRFAFTLYEPGGCDTLKVTNGCFDVKF
jgi:hypothetical protein